MCREQINIVGSGWGAFSHPYFELEMVIHRSQHILTTGILKPRKTLFYSLDVMIKKNSMTTSTKCPQGRTVEAHKLILAMNKNNKVTR